ncbi:MAG TPA: DUF5107 domain-containing protein, partial [Kineosporiaceae bacterium]|nr:DUF5107 domain-containing protein [Kineosporiaceae bacterium]
ARRATTGFPRATTPYYGIDYPARVRDAEPDADRLDWYRSIPVPTSYMCIGSRQSFFGGYDHAVGAGFVHWADVGISPGKKQWTWGNDRFGHAWDRNLTDADGPYVELMAGVFTDNQPDFSFLAPAETKTFSQYWYPVQRIGVVHQATTEVALHAAPDGDTRVRLGVAVTRVRPGVEVALELPDGSAAWRSTTVDLAPGGPLQVLAELPRPVPWEQLAVVVRDGHGELLRWVPGQQRPAHEVVPAVEPPAPAGVAGVEELYLIGLHLAQYRHATRSPEPYWREALRRDPGDVRSLTALAARAHARAQYEEAAELLERAVDRLTTWNANPYDGEPHYRLGLALLRLGRQDDADEALAKAAWSQAWRAPAALERARRRCAAGDWAAALSLLDEALTLATGCLAARDLRVLVLRRLGREAAAQRQLTDTLAVDPLDWWARDLAGHPLTCDARTRLDVAQEYAAAGFVDDALRVAASAAVAAAGEAWTGVLPLAHYRRAQLLDAAGRSADAAAERRLAAAADSTWCFPAGLDDESALRAALRADPADGRAAGLLGHWLYDAGRGEEAARMWRLAVEVDPDDVVCWRNLALAAVNVDADLAHAGRCLDRAVAAAPRDARLRFERDQLAKRARVSPAERLSALEPVVDLVRERDDLTIEYVALLVAVGRAQEALHVLEEREFQPWEGGEGQALAAWERVRLVLAAQALGGGRAGSAEEHLRAAIDPPAHLGEAPHPLANRADLFLLLGDALAAQGRDDEARAAWTTASAFVGDFLLMSTEPHSEKTVACALALRRSGRHVEADHLLGGLEQYARALVGRPAKVDYFATSLPDLLLFDDDLAERQHTRALLLQAFACAGRDELAGARRLVEQVLDTDPNLAAAQDLSRALQPEGRRLLSGRWPAPSAAG